MVDLWAVCLVQAAGHHPCSAPLSRMPSGIVIVVIVAVCRRHHCHCCAVPAVVVVMPLCTFVTLCPLAVPLGIIACRCHCHTVVVSLGVFITVPFHHTPLPLHVSIIPLLCRSCVPSLLHCCAVVMPLDPPPSSPSIVVTAQSLLSRGVCGWHPLSGMVPGPWAC